VEDETVLSVKGIEEGAQAIAVIAVTVVEAGAVENQARGGDDGCLNETFRSVGVSVHKRRNIGNG
jgi:hypothetical protein